jgi:hypothetical protein
MPLQTPDRAISTAPKCDRPVPGSGVMSYHCSLPQGHEGETLDPEDPQPCYAIESDRSGRAWDAWRRREDEREVSKGAAAVGDEPQSEVQWLTCPVCSNPSLKVTPTEAECQECGAKPEVQADAAVTVIGPDEPAPSIEEVETDVPEGFVSTASTPDPEIMAAAQQAVQQPDSLSEDEMDAILRGERPEGVPDIPGVTVPLTGITGLPTCEVCTSPDRLQIEKALVEGWAYSKIMAALPEGHELTVVDIKRHLERHMPPDPGYASHMTNAGAGELSMCQLATCTETEVHSHNDGGWMVLPRPTKQREGDQRLPAGGDRVVQDWIHDRAVEAYQSEQIDEEMLGQITATMSESKRVGTERYGQPLKTFDGRLNIKDLAEELRDAFVYVSKLQMMAEADKDTLVRMAVEGLRVVVFGEKSPYHGEKPLPDNDRVLLPMAEAIIDRILDWVLIQRLGPEQVRPEVGANS